MRVHPRRAVLALLGLFTAFYTVLNLANLGSLGDGFVGSLNMQLQPVGSKETLHFTPPRPRAGGKWSWTRGLQEAYQAGGFDPGGGAGAALEQVKPSTTERPSVWPSPWNETNDRIVQQISYIPASLGNTEPRPKLIVWYPNVMPSNSGFRRFQSDRCQVQSCYISGDPKMSALADALVFANMIPSTNLINSLHKLPHQVWVFYQLESPVNTPAVSHLRNLVNWTATYRRDSTIVTPYEKFVPFKNLTSPPSKNYAQGKTKKVAWFVSNCNAGNNRWGYVEELAKHIKVDIYGVCGELSCSRQQSVKCFNKLRTEYKFYISFENSNCRDYITEKLYWNALQNDVVPIVMGATKEDYEYAAPPGSFIYADDFETPKALAEYLVHLDKNDDLYNNYFKWKGTGEFINTYFYCRLCAMLHDKVPPTWYDDFGNWWGKSGTCVRKSARNKFSSWRIFRQQNKQRLSGNSTSVVNEIHDMTQRKNL